jgi:hypothetical protein
VVIVQHFAYPVKAYIAASKSHKRVFPVPDQCPHADCEASASLIRWGTYTRGAATGEAYYRLRIQRVRCKACGRTHSLLPDFLHPHRQFVISLLQHVVSLHLLLGLGWRRLMQRVPQQGPARSTVREWVASFSHAAANLLLEPLLHHLLALQPGFQLPHRSPGRLRRLPHRPRQRRLQRAHTFWRLAEHLYALIKAYLPRLHFTARQLFPFLLHWLQLRRLPPRLFWSPLLATTPTQPF